MEEEEELVLTIRYCNLMRTVDYDIFLDQNENFYVLISLKMNNGSRNM